jgi:hypothetical protein
VICFLNILLQASRGEVTLPIMTYTIGEGTTNRVVRVGGLLRD